MQEESSPVVRRSAVRSGALTGMSSLVLSTSAAAAGVVFAHEFGRTAKTDGFLAAYGIYLVFVLGAQAFRLVIVPDLTRARAEGRLAPETRAYALAFLGLAVPVSLAVGLLAHPIGDAITGDLPPEAASLAGRTLEWLVPAAFAQLLAGLASSALAALDRYGAAALGYAAGGIAGFALFFAFRGHGLLSLAWGLALNGALSLAIPLVDLVRRGALSGAVAVPLRVGARLRRLVHGAAVPLAIQGLYAVSLRLAAGLGVGEVTSLSYAYLIAGALVTATASALSLVSAAPLTRRGLDPEGAAAHVVHSAWVSLALVGAAAGVFALVGGRVVEVLLGEAYGGGVGLELGRLVVELAPWMVAFVVFAAAYPLVFVMESERLLVPLAVVTLGVDAGVSLALRAAFGIAGIAVGMAVAILLAVAALMTFVSGRMLAVAARGLVLPTLAVAAAAGASFGLLRLAAAPVAAAVAGLAVYALLLAVVARLGLRDALRYVRALHDAEPGSAEAPGPIVAGRRPGKARVS